MKINRHILDNGLRLVHSQDESTQMVALNVLYNVGARDEHPEHTGFAHLFEHLMFGGSVNIPDYDMPLQLAGGENNAWPPHRGLASSNQNHWQTRPSYEVHQRQ